MKCNNCGFDNKNTAKFCSRCGASLEETMNPPKEPNDNNQNTKIIIAVLVIIVLILAVVVGFFAINSFNNSKLVQSESSQSSQQSGSQANSSSEQPQKTTPTTSEAKEWKLIGSYSGSGTGSKSINVPPGQIMIKISAYPIKNYATNYLYVDGPSGESVGVDWGSNSPVQTRSNSMTFTSSSSKVFTIKYYETVSWNVEFYRYE